MVVDHKWRDLPGHSLLAAYLTRRYGYDVQLTRIDVMAARIVPFMPHMVILPNTFGESRETFARQLAAQNIHVAVLPTEGIAYGDQATQFLAHKWTDVSNVDLFLAWGPCLAETIQEHNIMPPEKVKVVGCVRFDFHKEPLRALAKSREQFITDHGLIPEWPVVVWATNYVYAGFSGERTEFCVKNDEALGLKNVGNYKGAETIEFDFEDRRRGQAAVREFLAGAKNINFVIKPHPGESVEEYSAFVDSVAHDSKCVKVVSGEYISDVLNAADLLVQRLSTACIDAWCAGVDTIELLPMDSYDDYVVTPVYSDGSWCVSNGRQLADAVRACLSGAPLPADMYARRSEILQYLCHKVDGKSHIRIADAIHEFLDAHSNTPRMRWDSIQLRWAAEGVLKTLFRLPQNLKGRELFAKYILRKRIDDYLGRFDKIVTDDAVQMWMEHWERVLAV